MFPLKTPNSLILKNMVKIITQAPYKSPMLARYQAVQIGQAKEMATQIPTSVSEIKYVWCLLVY